MGASKRNVSQVFNAETGIIGLLAGILGVGITLILIVPGNAILHHAMGTDQVNAALPLSAGVILVVLSIVLTLIGGLIPSRKAAKQDPATALRTE
jgi:putative ABC transport system permease protein